MVDKIDLIYYEYTICTKIIKNANIYTYTYEMRTSYMGGPFGRLRAPMGSPWGIFCNLFKIGHHFPSSSLLSAEAVCYVFPVRPKSVSSWPWPLLNKKHQLTLHRSHLQT